MELTTDCQKHWFLVQKQWKISLKKHKRNSRHGLFVISALNQPIHKCSFNFQLIIFIVLKFRRKKNFILTITTQVCSNDKSDSVAKITQNSIYLFTKKKNDTKFPKSKMKLFETLYHTGSPIIFQRSLKHPISLTVKNHMLPMVVAGQLEKSLSCHLYTSLKTYNLYLCTSEKETKPIQTIGAPQSHW